MPRTRLNRDKRDVLLHLAAKAVEATPIDPAVERRVKEAQKAYDKAHLALTNEARSIIAKKIPVSDVAILRKYELTRASDIPLFVNMDTRDHFQVHLFNEREHDREHKMVGSLYNYEEIKRLNAERAKAREATQVDLPIMRTRGGPGYKLSATAKLLTLVGKLREADDERNIAEGADRDKRRNIERDFLALIAGSRTFEDVIAAWPEARTVTDQIVGIGTEISLVSSEAIERIRANMTARGIDE